MIEPAVPTACPKCGATTTWAPAIRGTVTAEACGHVVTYDEAFEFFPERMIWVEDEIVAAFREER